MAESEEALAALPPGTRVALPDRLHPDAVAWCLAVQARGLVAVPLPEDALREAPEAILEAAGCTAWADGVGGPALQGSSTTRIERLVLPPIPGPFDKGRSPAPASRPAQQGSVVLRLPGGAGEEVSFPELVARAEASFAGLPRAPSRDILVLTGSLADPTVQLLLTWSLLRAAALLLEPALSAYAATVDWARPTLLAGTAATLAALHQRLTPKAAPPRRPWHRRPRGPLARPLDRVRAVVVLGGEKPDETTTAQWRQLGVPLVGVS